MDLVKLRRVVKELEETKKMAVKCRKKLDAIKKSNGKWEVEMAEKALSVLEEDLSMLEIELANSWKNEEASEV
tara:strand:+ start:133 stop:351 length:219 start_codon:yes stop_codon:yes gene_type:complete